MAVDCEDNICTPEAIITKYEAHVFENSKILAFLHIHASYFLSLLIPINPLCAMYKPIITQYMLQMLNTMCSKFQTMRRTGSTSGRHQLAQLLMVVSDGRGLFLEGVEKVKQAVRMAISSGIFLVFVVIDNPHGKVMQFITI